MFVADYNFSHRIDHLSFGEQTAGIIAPLDSEEKVIDQSKRNKAGINLTKENCLGST